MTITRRAKAQTIHTHHTGFLHSHPPYIINYHEQLTCFMQLFTGITTQVLAFSWLFDLEWTSSLWYVVALTCSSKFQTLNLQQIRTQRQLLSVNIKANKQTKLLDMLHWDRWCQHRTGYMYSMHIVWSHIHPLMSSSLNIHSNPQ